VAVLVPSHVHPVGVELHRAGGGNAAPIAPGLKADTETVIAFGVDSGPAHAVPLLVAAGGGQVAAGVVEVPLVVVVGELDVVAEVDAVLADRTEPVGGAGADGVAVAVGG